MRAVNYVLVRFVDLWMALGKQAQAQHVLALILQHPALEQQDRDLAHRLRTRMVDIDVYATGTDTLAGIVTEHLEQDPADVRLEQTVERLLLGAWYF